MNIPRLSILLFAYGIFASAGAMVLLIFLSTYEAWYFRSLAVLLVISVAALISYVVYQLNTATQLLVLGDQYSDKESLVSNCDQGILGVQLRAQIIPTALLDHDTPRTRFHLARLKGSWIRPPRIVIAVNAERLSQTSEGEKMQLLFNLNRVLHLLRHNNSHQQIDIIFSRMENFPGYNEFTTVADCRMRFSTSLSMRTQLESKNNYCKALLSLPASRFMQFLRFLHNVKALTEAMDRIVAELLLECGEPGSQIYFAARNK